MHGVHRYRTSPLLLLDRGLLQTQGLRHSGCKQRAPVPHSIPNGIHGAAWPHLHWEKQNAMGWLSSAAREKIRDGSMGRAKPEWADRAGTGCGSGMKWGASFWGCFWAVWGFLCVSPLVLPFSAPTESSIEEIFESLNSRIPGAIAVCKASVVSLMVSLFSGQFSSRWSRLSLSLPMIKSLSFSSRANSHA